MAQRDYVRRGQPAPSRRKKNTPCKKQRNTSSVNPVIVAIAVAVLVAFIGGLWFLSHHKKEELPVLPDKATGNGLPPKPEERWRYIKELESRQPGISQPTEPSAGGEIKNQDQLTDEQRQLLQQMQADMRQQPTPLNEVPWNEQTPAQRQQTLQRQQQQLANQQRQQQSQQRQLEQAELERQQQAQLQRQQQQAQQPRQPSGESSRQQPEPPSQQPRTEPARQVEQPRQQVQQPAKTSAPQPYDDLIQTPPHTTAEKPKAAAPITHEPASVARSVEQPAAEANKDTRSWMIQCGSFKGTDQAESVRAQLAFESFDSHITTNNGWNRVVIGPFKGKEKADSTLNSLKSAGHGNCIRLAAGG